MQPPSAALRSSGSPTGILDADTSRPDLIKHAPAEPQSAVNHFATPPDAARPTRKPSPGLLARLRLLDRRRRPATTLDHVEQRHRDHSLRVSKSGRAWAGSTASLERPLSSATSFSESVMDTLNGHESDHSSIISTSERLMASDSEDDVGRGAIGVDTQKYRLPDIGKARGTSRQELARRNGHDTSRPPTPPPKDQPANSSTSTLTNGLGSTRNSSQESLPDPPSYFNPYSLSRAGSVYTLSRVSFTNQLSQLTSIKLPQASSLASSISAIPTSTAAARALTDAAGSIKIWISKASEVLDGLDAEDDVEWAAQGGREGVGEVDTAINRFESLIKVFVIAIEELQSRPDIDNLPPKDLGILVEQLETILQDWERIRDTLKGVKDQVEIAMEWEELWNIVLGEIGMQLESLSRLVFEMEERRHHNPASDMLPESASTLDYIGELETIVEEAPSRTTKADNRNRFSLGPGFSTSENQGPVVPQPSQDDSNLLALFARMQPLRAALDFLPMTLSRFLERGRPIFPSAAEELEKRRGQLEDQWRKLEADAESLRRELGEDRWILVFRNAGRQALKMCESVERSLTKIRDAMDEGSHHTNIPAMTKKIEQFEAKKMHYGPAIERVLAIIDRGVQDRLTVNGEILRLQADMKKKWEDLQAELRSMDFVLETLNMGKTQQLRDSVSTILSSDRSVTSSAVDTPGSSPASSVIMMSRKSSDQGLSTPPGSSKGRQKSFTGQNRSTTALNNRRLSSLPTPSHSTTHLPTRKTPAMRSSASTAVSSPTTPRSVSSPTPFRRPSAIPTPSDNKPRWNGSVNMKDTVVGHNFKPLSASTPSPHSKIPGPNSPSSTTSIPIRSPLSRQASATPRPPSAMASAAAATAHARAGAQTPSGLRRPSATPRLRPQASTPQLPSSAMAGARRKSNLAPSPLSPAAGSSRAGAEVEPEPEPSPSARRTLPRATSAMGGRKTSTMLPQPKSRVASGPAAGSGRESRAAGAGRGGGADGEKKPPWRYVTAK